jgi:T5SS/PEP-CTERM-associated repeat protein
MRPRRLTSARLALLAAVAGTVGIVSNARAADRFWITPGGGTFSAIANWSTTAGGAGGASVPVAADTANFTLNNTYTVNLTAGLTNSDLDVEFGTVTLNMGNNGYTLTGASGLVVGNVAAQAAQLNITNGLLACDSNGDVFAIATAATGVLNIDTGGTIGTSSNRPSFTVGSGASGTVTAQNGGRIIGNALDLGFLTGMTGVLNVNGTSSIDFNSTVRIGRLGSGFLNLNSGAHASVTSSTFLGDATGASGNLLITADSSWSGSAITVGNSGNGTLAIQLGGTMTCGTCTIAAGPDSVSSATVSGNLGTSVLTVGYSGDGRLDILFGGRVTSSLATLSNGGNATVNVSQGSRWDIAGSIVVGSFGPATMNIAEGSVVANTSASVGGNTFSTSGDEVGVVTISGAGSAWQNTGNVNVGNGLGVGSVKVDGGGNFSTTGTLTLNRGTLILGLGGSADAVTLALTVLGRIDIDGGTLSVANLGSPAGVIHFNSGRINLTANHTLDRPKIEALLGPDVTLRAGRTLGLTGNNHVINDNLTIDGGYLAGNFNAVQSVGTLDVRSGGVDGSGSLTINSLLTLGGTGRLLINLDNNGTILVSSDLITIGRFGNSFNNGGTFRGGGSVYANFVNFAPGRVNVLSDDHLRFIGNGTNNGTFSILGGELETYNTLTNGAGTGLISARDAILRFHGGLTNNGSIAMSNGTVDVYGDINQTIGGRITVSNGGIANFYDDVTIAAGAASVQATAIGSTVSRVVFFGSYNGGLTGGGQAFIEGDHRPGNSPGLVSFSGDVSYGPFAALHEELAGTTRGTQYDALNVTGTASLAGTLDATLLGAFNPAYLTYFDVINAGTLVGKFDTFTGRQINPQKFLVQVYSPTQLRLAVALPGDANIDGAVNFADLVVLAQNYNLGNAIWQTGDFSGNGIVGFEDLVSLAQNYNQSVLTGEQLSVLGGDFVADWALAQSLVPEPALLLVGMTAPLASRRRRP